LKLTGEDSKSLERLSLFLQAIQEAGSNPNLNSVVTSALKTISYLYVKSRLPFSDCASLELPKRQDKVDGRRKRIVTFLEKAGATGVESGKTVQDISRSVNESPSSVRVDLEALRAEGIKRDKKRVPNVYWKER